MLRERFGDLEAFFGDGTGSALAGEPLLLLAGLAVLAAAALLEALTAVLVELALFVPFFATGTREM